MNKDEFKEFAKGSVTDAKTIMKLMKALYEADITEFFPENIWENGNPVMKVYNDWLNKENFYSPTGNNRLYYSDIVKELGRRNSVMNQKLKEDIAFYVSNSCQIYMPNNYNKHKP